MHFQPFHSIFPKIADCETRVLTVRQDETAIPSGEYGFVEFYCTDKKCDCRRVMIYVFTNDRSLKDPCLAVLSFGWESKAFYRKWSPSISDDELKWFKGPALEPFKPQTKYSEQLLEFFKMMLDDTGYRQRIIKHYVQYKQKTGMKIPKDLEGLSGSMQDCGCKSGLKFRFCCGEKK